MTFELARIDSLYVPTLLQGIAALIVDLVLGAIYHLYGSLLAKIPGPRPAALMLSYEICYDFIK